MKVDFARTAQDYRMYRHGFPPEFFKRLKDLGLANINALDIGTGTGTVARGLVDNGCNVTAIDISPEMLDQARIINNQLGYKIKYMVGSAEYTKQAEKSFDLVTAGQCWHWFNGEKALAEIRRILKPNGRLVIAHYDWIPFINNVAFMTEQLILKYNPNWQLGGQNGFYQPWATQFYPSWINQLMIFEFTNIETFSFDVMAEYSHEGWLGRVRASAGISASNLSNEDIFKFNEELKDMILKIFPKEPLNILHRCSAIIAKN